MLKIYTSAICIVLPIVICSTTYSMHTTKSSKKQINSPYTSVKKCPFHASIIKTQHLVTNPPKNKNFDAAYQYGLELETVYNNLAIIHEELRNNNLKYLNNRDILSEEEWHCTKTEELFYQKIVGKLVMLADLYTTGVSSLSNNKRKYILLTHAQKEYDTVLKQCLELEKSKSISPYDVRVLINIFDTITLQTDCSEKTTRKHYKHKTARIITMLSQLKKMVDPQPENVIIQKKFEQIWINLEFAALCLTSKDTKVSPYELTSSYLENAEDACSDIEELVEKNSDKNSSKHQSQSIMYQEFYKKLTQLQSEICKEYCIADPLKKLRGQVRSLQCLVRTTLTRLFTPAAKTLLERTKKEIIDIPVKNKYSALRTANCAIVIHNYLILPPYQNKNLDLWRWKSDSLKTIQSVENNSNELILQNLWQTRDPITPCISLTQGTQGWRNNSFGQTCENAITYFSFFNPKKIDRETSCECVFANLWLDVFYKKIRESMDGSIKQQLLTLQNHQWVDTQEAKKRFKLLLDMIDTRIDRSNDSDDAYQKIFLNTINKEIEWATTAYEQNPEIIDQIPLIPYLEALSNILLNCPTSDNQTLLNIQSECNKKLNDFFIKMDKKKQ